jgi:PAS domain S-box-containing protein
MAEDVATDPVIAAILRSMADAVIAIDARRSILGMNAAAERLFGVPGAEAIGRPCHEVVRADLCRGDCPFPSVWNRGESVGGFEARLQQADGAFLPVWISASVFRDRSGNPWGVIEAIRDLIPIRRLMSGLQQANAELARKENALSAILSSLADGVITTDLELRITGFNAGAEKLTGLTRVEVLGRRCRDVLKGSLCDIACPLLRTLRSGNRAVEVEQEICSSSGERIPVSATTSVLREATGAVTGGVLVYRDLRQVRRLQAELQGAHRLGGIVGGSVAIQEILEMVKTVAPTDATVLIQGESGTGKELVAATIHRLSPRGDRPFVKVNCAALVDTLLESELFGHVRGAFTGAMKDRPGRFELADTGTIFLDEVSAMSPVMQAKLLRVLQEREFERVGSTRTVRVDVRVVASTNRDLWALVQQGAFREDLYYRLHVVPIAIPPLRERKEDIPPLVEHFLTRALARGRRRPRFVSPEAMRLLLEYDWPGNVRQLENSIEYALICNRGEELLPEALPPDVRLRAFLTLTGKPKIAEILKEREREEILKALADTRWRLGATAQQLGIGRTTLWRRMKRLRIPPGSGGIAA